MAYDISAFTRLEALQQFGEEVNKKFAKISNVEALSEKVDKLEGSEPNKIDEVRVNGKALQIADKIVDILIASGTSNGSIKVNNVDVAVTGLAALAYKAKVSEEDLETALKTKINDKLDTATFNALQSAFNTLKGDATGSVKEVVDKAINDFANETSNDGRVNTIKELVDWVAEHGPEAATMSAGISKNTEAIEALKTLIGTIPTTATSTDIVGYIAEEIKKLAIGDYVKTEDLNTKLQDYVTSAGLTEQLGNYVEKDGDKQLSEVNFTSAMATKLSEIEVKTVKASTDNGYIKVDGQNVKVYELPEDVLQGRFATSEEVADMLKEVFGN